MMTEDKINDIEYLLELAKNTVITDDDIEALENRLKNFDRESIPLPFDYELRYNL